MGDILKRDDLEGAGVRIAPGKANSYNYDYDGSTDGSLAVTRANGLSILEIPIDWNERHEAYSSSVKLVRAAWEEFSGMRRIRRRLKAGDYRF